MFQFLRSQAKMFYWVIAGSFAIFGFFMYAGDNFSCSKKVARRDAGIIGSVNGQRLTAQAFDQAVRQQLNAMRQQSPDRELTANQMAMAQDRAWESLVQSAIVEQAIRQRKIKVTDQEVLDVFRNNPPAEVLAQYRDESGNVDMNRYYADLQNPKNDWSQIEAYVREMLPRQKLTEQIAADAVVSDEDVRREYVRQTGRAMAEYMGVVFTDISDGYNPTDQEISDWYAAHPDDYKHDGQATCKVVRFAKTPSSADDKDVLDSMTQLRQDILDGKLDFATAAKQYSDDPGSGARGGDIGSFDRSRMVPEFANAAFALPMGQISAPVRTKFGYHLIEVTAQQTGPGGQITQVTARHILEKVTPGPQTLDLISEAANAFHGRVNASNFVSTAEAEALDLVKPGPVLRGRDIPGLALSMEGTNWLFTAQASTISPVFENDECYYVVLAERVEPAGTRTLDEVRSQVMLALRKQHNTQVAKQRLDPAVAAVQAGTTLRDVAARFNLKYAVSDTFSYNSNVADVGYGTDFNKAVIDGLVGRPTAPIETARGVYVAMPLWIKPISEADFAAKRANIQQSLLVQAQSTAVQKWLEDQKKAAKIEDQRAAMRGNG
jgi:parvulin-like peptidyl-prolyl isomerase